MSVHIRGLVAVVNWSEEFSTSNLALATNDRERRYPAAAFAGTNNLANGNPNVLFSGDVPIPNLSVPTANNPVNYSEVAAQREKAWLDVRCWGKVGSEQGDQYIQSSTDGRWILATAGQVS